MSHLYHETIHYLSPIGIRYGFADMPGGYHPNHWHQELEILYPLNGEFDIWVDRTQYHLKKRHLTVIESSRIHSTYSPAKNSMFLCIHLSKKHLEQYLPDIETRQIQCSPPDINDDNFPQYRRICELMEALTRLYIRDTPFLALEAEGIILQALACLFRDFSTASVPAFTHSNQLVMQRIRDAITYVEEHFREPITLDEIAGRLGLSNEYFCRFFKRHMGVSFFSYVNQIRLARVYRDLERTNMTISEIMEQNGFTNQKLFNSSFKKQYGLTPSQVRKKA